MGNKKVDPKAILIVDDHPLMRTAVRTLLTETYPDVVIHESDSEADVLQKLKLTNYDLIIMDIQMPNCEALSVIAHIHLKYAGSPVLVYSMSPEDIYAVRVLKAGARGFVSKNSSIQELKNAISLVASKKPYISQNVADILSRQRFFESAVPFTRLSSRELQIAAFLLSGTTVGAISKILKLGVSTVSTHKSRIFQKLKVANLLELKLLSDIYQFTAGESVLQPSNS